MAPAVRQSARESRNRSAARAADDRDDLDRDTRQNDRDTRQNDRDTRQNDSERLGEEVGAFEGVAHNIANDVNALVQAWSEANAEVVKGLVTVVGDLFIDLNQSVGLKGRRVSRRGQRTGQRGDPDRDDTENNATDATRVSRSLSDAVKGTANVIQRSGQRFQRRYERIERGDEDDGDGDRPNESRRPRARGERDDDFERSEEARERQYKDTVQQREDDVAADPPASTSKTKP